MGEGAGVTRAVPQGGACIACDGVQLAMVFAPASQVAMEALVRVHI